MKKNERKNRSEKRNNANMTGKVKRKFNKGEKKSYRLIFSKRKKRAFNFESKTS